MANIAKHYSLGLIAFSSNKKHHF